IALCVGTGINHLINVVETNQGNGNTSWIITDSNGEILEIPMSTPLDFSNAQAGTCYIYQINYLGAVNGLDVGENINLIEGCYILSNGITVIKTEIAEPAISFENGEFVKIICTSDSDDDLLSFITENTAGDGYYVVTDESGLILEIQENDTLDFSDRAGGICHIYFLNADGEVSGLEEGENIIDLSGCFKISNQLVLNKLEFVSETSFSSVCFDFDSCNAIVVTDDNMDYSEFTADITADTTCSQLTVIGDHLYRQNPETNIHSCTPGLNGSAAICITAGTTCDFVEDSELALRFDILVEPGSNNFGNISGLSFYERAPLEFQWIDGATGLNNYPLRFGLRVLKDGEEVYRTEDVPTSLNYTLQEFDFSDLEAFTIYEATTFSFELLAYCPIGNNGFVEIWDLEDIKVLSDCESQLAGGELSSMTGLNSDEVCVDDGVADDLQVISTGTTGPNVSWVLTDSSGTILDLPDGPLFDFEGTGSGTVFLWRICFVNGLQGLIAGGNTSDLEGCYEFSNPLTILKRTGPDCPNCLANGGIVTLPDGSTEITLCTDDGADDNLSFNLFGNVGSTSIWLITNEDGVITEVLSGDSYNFEGTGQGSYLVWHIAYEGVLQNITVGNNLNSLLGCFDLSNPVTVLCETTAGGGCTNIVQPEDDEVFMLAPNPVDYELGIHLHHEMGDDDFTYAIFNRLGKVLISGKMNSRRTNVDVSALSSGMYYIRVMKNRKRMVESFVKI
ncbi:MAG: T9SS type A sorting domain-containing protein, partial [Bacteroidia bacterium]|nr:T9SS type A sorting domain-containing protein [Bacteroidia bacterium]